MMDKKTLEEHYEQASKDAHYAYNQDQRDRAVEQMQIIKLALETFKEPLPVVMDEQNRVITNEDGEPLDFSEKDFFLKFTVRRSFSNEVGYDHWFNPEEIITFLQERHVVAREVEYGLDAFHKHSGQDILAVELVENVAPKKNKVKIIWRGSENISVFLNKELVASANYDEHGSSGIFTLEKMAKAFAKVMNAKLVIKEY